MDSPNTRQTRSAYADPSTHEPAFRHGSSSEAQHALVSPAPASSSSARTQERHVMSAQSMEREALALSQDGIPCDVSYANVRRLDAGVSRSAEDAAPLPHDAEQLANAACSRPRNRSHATSRSRALIVLRFLQARALSAAKRLTPILTRSPDFESR